MSFLLEGNQESHPRRPRPGTSSHQRTAHKILVENHYRFARIDGNGYNHYVNEWQQEIIVVNSPRNSSEGINRIHDTIRRQHRSRMKEAHVPATKTPDLADQLVAMADPLLIKPLGPEDHQKSQAARIKYQAYVGWLRRVYEKHGPLPTIPLELATDRLGLSSSAYRRARKELGVVVYRESDDGGKAGHGRWLSCLPWQLPEEKKARDIGNNAELGVEVTPRPEGVSHLVVEEGAITLRENGKPDLTEQQTAALMLLESVGLKMPGDEARDALDSAIMALNDAREALSKARSALGA